MNCEKPPSSQKMKTLVTTKAFMHAVVIPILSIYKYNHFFHFISHTPAKGDSLKAILPSALKKSRELMLPPAQKGPREVMLLTISIGRSQGGDVTYHQHRKVLER